MNLTNEQRDAVAYPGNALLEACPGSGKTRAIVAKALQCAEGLRDTPRKVAVITYTNAAVDEIDSRLRIYGTSQDIDCCEVSTIHAFCLNNIIRRFYWRTDEFPTGFQLLPPDSEAYELVAQKIRTGYGLPRDFTSDFSLLNRDLHGVPILPRGSSITSEAAYTFWEELRNIGAMDFATAIYLTSRLLERWPSLANALSSRYGWILVDEFQDTTELQVEILKKIHQAGRSSFFLVGDPHQSIFGFAGARPSLLGEFSTHISACSDFHLTQNWRSNPQIVAHAERLLPRATPMQSTGVIANDKSEPTYVHAGSPFEAIEDHFLPTLDELAIPYGEAAILAPNWFNLFLVGRLLRNYGVPIIGPGARPYRRSHLFARLAEYVCAYLASPEPFVIRNIERALQYIIVEVTGERRQEVSSYSGRVAIYRILAACAALREKNSAAVNWLKLAAEAVSEILVRDNFLPASAQGLLPESAIAMREQMRSNSDVDVDNLTVDDLGLFASSGKSIHLLTMHTAKGREFEAVALIGLHRGQLPHWRATSTHEIDEARRLLYVGITRARRYLLYVTDTSHHRNQPCVFLGSEGLNLL